LVYWPLQNFKKARQERKQRKPWLFQKRPTAAAAAAPVQALFLKLCWIDDERANYSLCFPQPHIKGELAT